MIPSSQVSGDATLFCPYDKSHVILAKSFSAHLIKCRKNHKGHNMVVCTFDSKHLVPKPELSHHLTNCPSRSLLDRELQKRAGDNILRGDVTGPAIVSHQTATEEEDWDASATFYNAPALFNPGKPAIQPEKNEVYIQPGARLKPTSRVPQSSSSVGGSASLHTNEPKPSLKVFELSTKQAMGSLYRGRGRGAGAPMNRPPAIVGFAGPRGENPQPAPVSVEAVARSGHQSPRPAGRGVAFRTPNPSSHEAASVKRLEEHVTENEKFDWKNKQSEIFDDGYEVVQSSHGVSKTCDASQLMSEKIGQMSLKQQQDVQQDANQNVMPPQSPKSAQGQKPSPQQSLKANLMLMQEKVLFELDKLHAQQLHQLQQEQIQMKNRLLQEQAQQLEMFNLDTLGASDGLSDSKNLQTQTGMSPMPFGLDLVLAQQLSQAGPSASWENFVPTNNVMPGHQVDMLLTNGVEGQSDCNANGNNSKANEDAVASRQELERKLNHISLLEMKVSLGHKLSNDEEVELKSKTDLKCKLASLS